MPPTLVTQAPPTQTALLTAVGRLAERVAREPWFAAVGEPLTAGETGEAEVYLAGMQFAAMPVTGVADWSAAKALISDRDWDQRWWNAEENLRGTLMALATDSHSAPALMQALSHVTQNAADAVHGGAAVAATRAGVADAALNRVAAGAAAQCCYLSALATAVGAAPDHPFHAKYRLFAAGRWPLTISNNQFHLF